MVQKKSDVKARSMLLMALPNEHLMTFNQYKDAKTLFAAIQTRFGGNEATKKTQKTLLKQMYKNFSALRTTSSSSHNMAFVSSPSSTNEVNTAYGVSTANTQISPASTQVSTTSTEISTANLSDATVYAFLASQPNGSQLVHEDLVQIYEDNLEEIDLKWQQSRNQDSRNRNQDSSRRTVNVEETASKTMVAIDVAGFDWSYMADDEVPTNIALMAFLDFVEFQQPEFEGYGPKTSNSVSEDIFNEANCNYHQSEMVVSWNKYTRVNYNYSTKKAHPSAHKNMAPRAVLIKTDLKPLNTDRLANIVHPKTTVYSVRPMSRFSNQYNQLPNSAVVNVVRANQGNPQQELQEKRVIDSRCFRHMTGNMPIFVSMKKLMVDMLPLEEAPKEEKSLLLDESQVLLRVPRKNNMYSVDLRNVAPSRGLTFLFAKDTLDESNLWHRRLGHINFKTINKLNGVAEMKNKTLIEAARTMLADLKLPTTFWAEAVNIACYVQNRVLVIKPHNKTPYELFHGRTPSLSFMRPFGCPVIILNTLNPLGSRPTWLFDIDTLIKSMNYKPVVTGNQSNGSVGKARVEIVPEKDYILLPLWTQDPLLSSSYKDSPGDGFKPSGEEEKKDAKNPGNEDNEVLSTDEPRLSQEKDSNGNITNNISTVSLTTNAAGINDNVVDKDIVYGCDNDLNMPNLEEIVYSDEDEDVGAEADMTNLDTNILVSPIPTTRIHKDYLVEQIIKDIHSAP
nr:ribonuclease H-like domain-containing protein [Tanacetum cinerariifolium]